MNNMMRCEMEEEIERLRAENADLRSLLSKEFGAGWEDSDAACLRVANNKIEKLEAENKRLKTVPMKYRRMEFNAQLQKENERLEAELAAAPKHGERK